MITADLYIRVSTDEQADKGYSQRDQEERLRRYCSHYGIKIGLIIFEDHSAKNFNRPEWNNYLIYIKRKSTKTNLVLFTKWDRFSRNAADAYQMINTLKKYEVTPQAIEQPLDMSVPENKMMLAIYLSAPEVENDRRALNTFYGMRRAKKEGRVMGTAPYGYINRCSENGKKYIAIKEPEASNMRWAFNEIAKGVLAPDQIRQAMNKREGRELSCSPFHVAIRNPLYCGKIYIKQFKDEEAHYVEGHHEPLINETLFNKVQHILDRNKRNERPNGKVICDENFPLRGFLICPRCGRQLTGSGSKGSHNIYYYYHCASSCGFRYSAPKANLLFEDELRQYEFHPAVKDILKELLLSSYKSFTNSIDNKRTAINEEIKKANERMLLALDKLLNDKIDEEDYRSIKADCKQKISELEYQLESTLEDRKTTDIQSQLDKALIAITNLSDRYHNGNIEMKREIIRSMYPEKLEFDGTAYRTMRKNIIGECILLINSNLKSKKNRNNDKNIYSSCHVAPPRIELGSKV